MLVHWITLREYEETRIVTMKWAAKVILVELVLAHDYEALTGEIGPMWGSRSTVDGVPT